MASQSLSCVPLWLMFFYPSLCCVASLCLLCICRYRNQRSNGNGRHLPGLVSTARSCFRGVALFVTAASLLQYFTERFVSPFQSSLCVFEVAQEDRVKSARWRGMGTYRSLLLRVFFFRHLFARCELSGVDCLPRARIEFRVCRTSNGSVCKRVGRTTCPPTLTKNPPDV